MSICLCQNIDIYIPVPDWGGWLSKTGEGEKENHSTVAYMPPINSPITENKTVMHTIKLSEEVTASVKQEYTFITYDLAAAKKAYGILWAYTDRFHNVITRLGEFHMSCAYIGGMGKLVKGCGVEEVVLESGICASGSIEKVMNGKHYNRVRRVFRTVVDALEHLCWENFLKVNNLNIGKEEMELLAKLSKDPTNDNIQNFVKHAKCVTLLAQYEEHKAKIRAGGCGKTPQFWLWFMDKIWLLLRFLRATKCNNIPLLIACMDEMIPIFFSADRPNYAKYTPFYVQTLLNLPFTHPGAMELLENNGMSVNRSDVPNSRNSCDITIEQTINRHASGSGSGIIGFSRNFAAYHRWCLTRHARAEYLEATLEVAGIHSYAHCTHKDLNSADIKKSANAVAAVIAAFRGFTSPFEV